MSKHVGKYRVLIIDDETPARKNLQYLLEKESDIEVIGECKNGREAVKFVSENSPDLILLDIEMPDFDGFEVIRRLDSTRLPHVIFVTAYSEHAVKAFEVYAIDYILKPPVPNRFAEAINRFRKLLKAGERVSRTKYRQLFKDLEVYASESTAINPAKPSDSVYLKQFVIRNIQGLQTIRVERVDWIEAADHYVFVHSKGNKYLIERSLSAVEAQLSPNEFLRIRRNVIVNLKSITNVRIGKFGAMELQLKNGQKLKTSRLLSSEHRKRLIMSVPTFKS